MDNPLDKMVWQNEPIDVVAMKLLAWLSGMTPEEYQKESGGKTIEEVWKGLEEWQRDDYRFACRNVIKWRDQNPEFGDLE